MGYKYIESNGCYSKVLPEKNEKFWEVKSEEGTWRRESGDGCEEEKKVEDLGKCQFPLIGTPRE